MPEGTAAELLGVAHVEVADPACVALLAATLGIERRAVQHHGAFLAGAQRVDPGRAAVEREHLRVLDVHVLVAEEGRRRTLVLDRLAGRELARGARAFTLRVHLAFVAGFVEPEVPLARDVRGEIEREAIGVVELEHDLARNLGAFQTADRLVEQLHALVERGREAVLLLADDFLETRLLRTQLRIRIAHRVREGRDEPVEERLVQAELVTVPDRPPHDAAQDVAAAFVGRRDAIEDQEAGRADVIGDDFLRGARVRFGAGQPRDGGDQTFEDVDLVVVVGALHQRADALQAHARIDARRRQRCQRAVLRAVVLHEDDVPDLDPAVAILVGRAGRAAGNALAAIGIVVVEDLGAGAAGAGVAHAPEIVARVFRALVVADADDAVGRHADAVVPQRVGLVVGVVDGDQQAVLVDAEPLRAGDELPGEADRVFLEVVAEAEVAEHLEERVMPGGVADVLEIVVLAAGAHALLRGGRTGVGPPVTTGEDFLELHHAGVGEQQRGIVAGHQRARRHDLVALLAEIFQEAAAQFVAVHQIPAGSRLDQKGRNGSARKARAASRPAQPASSSSGRRLSTA